MQDKEDDKLVGVKSTALRFGAATPQWLAGFSAATLAGLAAAGAAVGLEWPFYAGLGAAGAHLGWQIATLKMDDRADCAAK
jgi:4-hydroxybenzoate polyprenyltransferase